MPDLPVLRLKIDLFNNDLETAISTNQTDEMAAKRLQLVLPRGLHATYTPQQQTWLVDVTSFTALVRKRQEIGQ